MYTNWDTKSLSLHNLHWYAVSTTISHLRSLRHLLMNEKLLDTSKIHIMEGTPVPAKYDSRFPEGKSYICEGFGPWIQRLDMIHLAIYAIARPERLDRNYSDYKTIGEAEVYAIKSIDQLLCDLANESTTIITRDIFERKYDLAWSDADINSNSSINNIKPNLANIRKKNGESSLEKDD